MTLLLPILLVNAVAVIWFGVSSLDALELVGDGRASRLAAMRTALAFGVVTLVCLLVGAPIVALVLGTEHWRSWRERRQRAARGGRG